MADKTNFLFAPNTGEIEEIYRQGAGRLLSLPEYPGSQATAPRPSSRPAPTRDDVIRRATELGVDPNLALSIWSQESQQNWNSPNSPKGAVGGMQVMPGTYRQMMGTDEGQDDPWNNMEAGLRYLAYGKKVLGTDDPRLLAAGYHAGYGRKELKQGTIPNTHDGITSTSSYAAKVAGRVGLGGRDPKAVQAELDAIEPGRYRVLTQDEARRLRLQAELDAEEPGRYRVLTPDEVDTLPDSALDVEFPSLKKQEQTQEVGFFERLPQVARNGWNNMARSLDVSRAVLSDDFSPQTVDLLAESINEQIKQAQQDEKRQHASERELKKAIEEFGKTEGWGDTTLGLFSLLGTAITNPRGVAIGTIEQLANMLPSMGGALAGAGTGAAVGAGVGSIIPGAGTAAGAATGALWGSRAGLAAGTAVLEFGNEITEAITSRLEEQKKKPTKENIAALLSDPKVQDEIKAQAAKKGLTLAAVDALTMGIAGKIGAKGVKAAKAGRRGAAAGYGVGAFGVELAGEPAGEAASQLVARGEINKADVAAEGIFGAGTAIGGTAIGTTMQVARDRFRKSSDAPAPGANRVEPSMGAEPESGGTSTSVGPDGVMRVEMAHEDPKPTGPIGRAIEKATGGDPEQAAEPAPVETSPRVRITAENGETMTGVAEQIGPDGSARVLGDDGQIYVIEPDSGVNVEVLEQPPVEQPAPLPAQPVEQVTQPEAPVDQPALQPEGDEDAARILDGRSEGGEVAADQRGDQRAAGEGNEVPPAAQREDTGESAPGLQEDLSSATADPDAKPALGQDLVVRNDGTPFKSEAAARQAAKNRRLKGYEPVEVDGGWALRPTEQPTVEPTNSLARTASWVIREKDTGRVVMETFDRAKVDALNTEKYEAVPAQQHLAEINDPNSKAGRAARQEQQAEGKPAAKPKKAKQPAMPRQDFDSTAGVGKISAVKERYSDRYGVSWASTSIAGAATMEEASAIAKAVADSGADNIADMRRVAQEFQAGRATEQAAQSTKQARGEEAQPAVEIAGRLKVSPDRIAKPKHRELLSDAQDGDIVTKDDVRAQFDAGEGVFGSGLHIPTEEQIADQINALKVARMGKNNEQKAIPKYEKEVSDLIDEAIELAAIGRTLSRIGTRKARQAPAGDYTAGRNHNTVAGEYSNSVAAKLREAAESAAFLEALKRRNPPAKPPRAAQRASEPREMTEEGRAKDGGPIMPGDTFRTLSGRVTTPYPKQKGERYASQWLIDNAAEEAESRGDDFNARIFRSTSMLRGGILTDADRESMLMYLFGEQPQVVPSILKPLSAKRGAEERAQKGEESTKQQVARTEQEAPQDEQPATQTQEDAERVKDLPPPPTLDYRLQERGRQLYLIPPVGKGFTRETRDSLVKWLSDAGYFASAVGDHRIAVSETDRSPSIDFIVDGVEEQRIGRAVAKERQERQAEEAEAKTAVAEPSRSDKAELTPDDLDRIQFPLGDNYRIVSRPEKNSVVIAPRKIGALYTDDDFKKLAAYGKPFGFTVMRHGEKKGYAYIVAPPISTYDWIDAFLSDGGVAEAARKQREQEEAEAKRKKEAQKEEEYRDLPSSKWIDENLGTEFTNLHNRLMLARVLDGVDTKFRGLIDRFWLSPLESIGFDPDQHGSDNADVIAFLKRKYAEQAKPKQEAAPAPSPAPAATKPKQEKAKPQVSKNTIFTDEAAEKARAILRAKLNQLNSGIDPEVMQAGITLAGYHIERGARTFAAYAKAMIEDMGEAVRPYLKSWYLGAKFDPRTAGMEGLSTAAEVEAFDLDNLDDEAAAETAQAPEGETDTVVTPSGREIEVRYKVVEADDLIPSNLDDGRVNPDYPQELQPRNRSKAASELQVNNIAAKMNPRLLGESASTTDGAPIVSPEGVVESGNGRTMAILRAYRRGLDSAQAYRDWLASQGYDVAGMRQPVLVRERVTPMSREELIEYTRESNARTTMQMSPEEQAKADGEQIGSIIDLYAGGDIANAANRPFVRAFIDQIVPQSEQGDMVTDGGALSIRGRKRIEAALMHAAYGDTRLVADLFVEPSTEIKTIGGAMLDSAASWLRMRNNADPSLDVTRQLVDAVNIVRRAREEDKTVYDVATQMDVFSGATDPVTMDFLGMFFRGDRFTRQRSREVIADMLYGYATGAEQVQPGPDMFGMEPPGAQEILRSINEKRQREEAGGQQGDIFAGGPQADDGGAAGRRDSGQGPRAGAQDEAPQEGGGQVNVPGTEQDLERDRANAEAREPIVPATDGNVAGRDAEGAGVAGDGAGQAEGAGRGDQRVPANRAATRRERGNKPVHRADGQFQPSGRAAGDTERAGSRSDSGARSAVEQQRETAVAEDAHAPGADDLNQRLAAQRKANKTPTKWGDKSSIDAALPLLLPEQREDVYKAEKRLDGNNGILFTNGTGTGKTATGLGIAKRFINDGKDNIIIVVPSDKIAADWVKFARMLGINLQQLEDTNSNGKSGPVVTTYANFGQNRSLVERDWDLVIADESHYLSSNENGDPTAALDQLRALTGHHAGFFSWVRQKYAKEYQEYNDAAEARAAANGNLDIAPEIYARLEAAERKAEAKWRDILDRERAKWDARWEKQDGLPKTVFLSATPFAYTKNTDYAEGYLFHYVEPAQLKNERGSRGYNQGGPRERFMMRHFGFRMRYNKLTVPDVGVNSQLMEQQFNEWLKQTGALSGRRLEVPFDYDRKFVLVDDAVGTKIDEALKYLREAEDGRYRFIYDVVMAQFDYQRRMYLLEAMKARAAVPIIREHMAAGRKVVVFHDFNKGGGFDPFAEALGGILFPDKRALAKQVLSQPMFQIDFSGLNSPIETMRAAFPDALFFNGTIPKSQRRANADLFNDDESGRNLIVVQSDAGREGVSLHDTTGKHQRVMINLGMPVKPVAATQIEGRIYRTGQASNAIFRYLTTGTAWEAGAFASKIAERASTAENLALGSEARGLKEAFIDAYVNAGDYPVSQEDGRGGKDADRSLSAALTASPFERAKTFYWAQQKNTKRRDQREGIDYFATPEPVGFKMVEWANIRPNEKVLEPSAGHGAIARFFPEQSDVTMVEPSYELSQRAGLANGNARIVNDTFESLHINNKYDAIVMNPPYGVGGKTAIEHMAKAAKHLREGGRIVALIPRGGMADRRLEQFLDSEDAKGLHTVAKIDMPSVTFERAGTSVNTQIVVLEKHNNPETAAAIQQRNIDLSDAKSINELFDRLENLSLPERVAPADPEQLHEIVEHITAKGKKLRGIIRTDLTADQAKAIDPYTFRKKNGAGETGWFIRSKYLDDLPESTRAADLQSRSSRARYSVDPEGRMVAEFGPVYDEFKDDPAAAIRHLIQAKDGEAVAAVTREGLGDISLIYGDKDKGLAHILDRHGQEILDRLPDLLANGVMYSKLGQKDRVYIGTPEAEATIRLDWDGKARTWLVTAFERYDEKKAPYRNLFTKEGRGASVTTHFGGVTQAGRIPHPDRSGGTLTNSRANVKAMSANDLRRVLESGDHGRIISALIDSGRVVLHDTVSSLPIKNPPTGVQGLTMPDGTIRLVAESLNERTATAVLLHEAFQSGGEALLGTQAWKNLMGRLGSLYRQGKQSSGRAREFFDAARARVAVARRIGVIKSDDLAVEEFGAYTIEHYEQAPAAFRKWVDDLIGAIKAWLLRRFGIQAGQVTPAQLRALAVAALREQAAQAAGGNRFSVADADTIEVDGAQRPTRNSNVQVAAYERGGEVFDWSNPGGRGLRGDFSRETKIGDTTIIYGVGSNGTAEIISVRTPQAKRGAGSARRALEAFLAEADQRGLQIKLQASPLDKKTSLAKLVQFYQSLGFELTGRKINAAGDPEMVRAARNRELAGGTFDADTITVDGKQRPTRNSNGQPIHHTEEGIRNFWRWFGSSRVVDDQGRPLVVYHGTTGDIRAFDPEKLGQTTGADSAQAGFFFARDPVTASNYATAFEGRTVAELKRRMDAAEKKAQRSGRQSDWAAYDALVQEYEAAALDESGVTDGANVIPAYLSLQNPLVYDFSGQQWEEGAFVKQIAIALTNDNDGVIFKNVADDPIDKARVGDVYVAFRPEQIKSATGNTGDFDPANPDIRYSVKPSRHFKDLTDEQKRFLDKIGPERLPQRLSDRWRQLTYNLGLRIRQAGVDRYAALLRNDEALYGADTLEGSIASSAWVLARMSNSAGGALSAMLNHGRIYLDPKEKVIDIREGTKGLRDVFQQLGTPQEIDRFMAWIAANRARKLMAEGRENLFTKDEIEAGINLSAGRMADGRNRGMTYAKAWKEFQQYRDDVLRIAEQSGTISKEQRELWSEEFYVPFYRVLDDDTIGGPSMSSGLSRQQAYKRLKGGKQNLNDLLENTLLNFHHLIQSALKNQAARQAIENAVALGIAEPTTESDRNKKASTFVMEDGQKIWYDVNDPLTFKALSAISSTGLNNPIMKVGRAFKRMFTNLTTVTPQFVIANLLRDSLSAMATSPTSPVPFANAVNGALVYGNEQNRARMIASGASFSFGHVYGQSADEIKAGLKGTLRKGRVINDPELIPGLLMNAWRKWNNATDFAENVNRAGIWERNLEKGKLKASFEARDLMDFSAHGDSIIIRIMTDLVPFLNARIQGLDKLYRSGIKTGFRVLTGKGTAADRKAFGRFMAVVGALSLLSMMLYMRNKDDEEYRKLEDWQRDTYWFIRFGDAAFFIPKPFEVGAIATLAERALEQFSDPTVAGEKFVERLWHVLTDTFALDLPQIIKPVYELSANRNTFTGRPIEDVGMQRLSPSLRVKPGTSSLAEGTSRAMEAVIGDAALSPLQIDHLIGAYLGQVGAGTVALADTFWRRAHGEQLPARRWHEYQPIKRFYRDLGAPAPYTRYSTDFYNALKESDKAYANVQKLIELQEFDRADALTKKEEDKLAMRKMLNRAQRMLAEINAEMRKVQMDKTMSGEEKRIQLDRLREERNLLTEQIGKDLEQERVRKREQAGSR